MKACHYSIKCSIYSLSCWRNPPVHCLCLGSVPEIIFLNTDFQRLLFGCILHVINSIHYIWAYFFINSIESCHGGTGVGQWSIKAMSTHAASLSQTRMQRCEILWGERKLRFVAWLYRSNHDHTGRTPPQQHAYSAYATRNADPQAPKLPTALPLTLALPWPSLFQPLSLPHLLLGPWQWDKGHSFLRGSPVACYAQLALPRLYSTLPS